MVQKRLIFGWCFAALIAALVVGCKSTKSSSSPAKPVASAIGTPVPDDGIIRAPGLYFLANDLLVDRKTGIEIKANGVTLDLRGHALRFTGEPKPGVNGIVFTGRSDVRIRNGAVGGFWYGIHCTSGDRARIHDLRFDDIPYIAVNVARSKNVAITDNAFSNFRYDIVKPSKSTYIIGVNVTSDDVLVANNRFDARPPAGTGQKLQLETVFVLFRPSRNCVVTHNDMAGSELMNRSYGVWVAEKTSVSILHNRIRNTQYGVTVATGGTALVAHNNFIVDPPAGAGPMIETIGISAPASEEFAEMGNSFSGLKVQTNIAKPAATKPTTMP